MSSSTYESDFDAQLRPDDIILSQQTLVTAKSATEIDSSQWIKINLYFSVPKLMEFHSVAKRRGRNEKVTCRVDGDASAAPAHEIFFFLSFAHFRLPTSTIYSLFIFTHFTTYRRQVPPHRTVYSIVIFFGCENLLANISPSLAFRTAVRQNMEKESALEMRSHERKARRERGKKSPTLLTVE